MHGYQTEAAVKLIAGMNYNYSTRGDNQLIVEHVSKKVQKDALKSIMKSLSAKRFMAIPKNILELFPPERTVIQEQGNLSKVKREFRLIL